MWQNTGTKTIAPTRVFLFHGIDVTETTACLLHYHVRDKSLSTKTLFRNSLHQPTNAVNTIQ